MLGRNFVLRVPNPFLKRDQIVMCRYHMVESRRLNGPLLALVMYLPGFYFMMLWLYPGY